MPVNVSPPLSNILMNLDVRQLREILIEIISWDATGKDIFDTDYLFQDPIKVRPNINPNPIHGPYVPTGLLERAK